MSNQDITEIVFSNRNKDYGAYFLRKNYKKYLLISLIISVICFSAAFLIPYFAYVTRIYRDGTPDGYKYVELSTEHLDFPKDKITSGQSIETMTLIPVIINDVALNSAANGGKDDQIYPYNENINSTSIGLLQSRPTFQGGDLKTFTKWVVSHIKYPEEAKKTKAQGSFKAIFVIEKDGSISNVKIESNADRSIEREIKRVISSSPYWSPGIRFGQPVRVQCKFPLTFTIK